MKKFKLIIVLLLAFVTLQVVAAGNNQIKYRIQCATSSEAGVSSLLKEVPELKSFTMPSGMKIYFSGGYFNKIESAVQRLKEVQAIGLKSAFIRVFKYNNMVSKPIGDKYIAEAKQRVVVSTDKAVEKLTTLASSKPTKTKLYSRKEIDALKKKAEERKAKAAEEFKKEQDAIAKDTTVTPMEEGDVEEEQEQVEEEVQEEENMVSEPPVYKILVGRSSDKKNTFEDIAKVNSEVIYSYNLRNEIVYAVGFYGNEAAAQIALKSFKKTAKNAEIIGVYKGKVISLKLANQLYEQFNAQK